MKSDQDLNKLLAAARELLNDIEAMRAVPDGADLERESWFGPFSESIEEGACGHTTISWPNLEISAAHLRDAMNVCRSRNTTYLLINNYPTGD